MRRAIEVQNADGKSVVVGREPRNRRTGFRIGIIWATLLRKSDGDLMGDGVNMRHRKGVAARRDRLSEDAIAR